MRRAWRLLLLCAWATAAAFVEVARLVPAVAERVSGLRRGHVRGFFDWLKQPCIWIVRQAVQIVDCWLIERRLTRALREAEQSPDLNRAQRRYLECELDELKESHEIELKRRAAVQQRVQGNATTIAVLTGLLVGGLALLNDDLFKNSESVGSLLPALLICVVVWLVMSGVSAIRVVGVQRQYDHWLQTREPADGPGAVPDGRKTTLVKMILLNQGYTIIVTNYATASHLSMRNAFVAMGGIVVAILCLR